jgi:hypothetical protein
VIEEGKDLEQLKLVDIFLGWFIVGADDQQID